MPAVESPAMENFPEKEISFEKNFDKVFKRKVEDVSDNLVSLRKSLTTVLDALYREDKPDFDIESLRIDIVNIKLGQELDHYNASARNYNAAMDKNSDFLIQVKGTNRDSKYFNKYIDGFPEDVAQIGGLSDEKAIEILDALSIEHRHDTDPNLRFTKDPNWDPTKHGHGHKKHHRPQFNGVSQTDDFDLEKARSIRLKRQVRAAYGLSPFHFATVTINAIDANDI